MRVCTHTHSQCAKKQTHVPVTCKVFGMGLLQCANNDEHPIVVVHTAIVSVSQTPPFHTSPLFPRIIMRMSFLGSILMLLLVVSIIAPSADALPRLSKPKRQVQQEDAAYTYTSLAPSGSSSSSGSTHGAYSYTGVPGASGSTSGIHPGRSGWDTSGSTPFSASRWIEVGNSTAEKAWATSSSPAPQLRPMSAMLVVFVGTASLLLLLL